MRGREREWEREPVYEKERATNGRAKERKRKRERNRDWGKKTIETTFVRVFFSPPFANPLRQRGTQKEDVARVSTTTMGVPMPRVFRSVAQSHHFSRDRARCRRRRLRFFFFFFVGASTPSSSSSSVCQLVSRSTGKTRPVSTEASNLLRRLGAASGGPREHERMARHFEIRRDRFSARRPTETGSPHACTHARTHTAKGLDWNISCILFAPTKYCRHVRGDLPLRVKDDSIGNPSFGNDWNSKIKECKATKVQFEITKSSLHICSVFLCFVIYAESPTSLYKDTFEFVKRWNCFFRCGSIIYKDHMHIISAVLR
ncbi:uncharacterized protein LOC116426568 isoform X2 [Nomia melanderi]|uniref:uncharacterized protein LOC116426568 isoform X2 n=1 Tax=Nomia melanderi TaxID=2448451 RepID=UPI003FCD3BA1